MSSLKAFLQDVKVAVDRGATRTVMGIDFGSSAIKLVVLEESEGKLMLKNYGSISLGPYAALPAGTTVSLTADKLAAALSDLLRDTGATASTIGVGIPLSASLIISATIPSNTKADRIETTISSAVSPQVPVPLDDVYIDWQLIKKDDEGNDHYLVYIINKDLLNTYTSALEQIGLQAKYYELESFSILRAALEKGVKEAAIVDIGAKYTKILVVKDGLVIHTKKVAKASNRINDILTSYLDIDFTKAEGLKYHLNISDITDPELRTQLETYVSDICDLSNRSIDKEELAAESLIYLSGGGILFHELPEKIAQATTRQVVVSQPFVNLDAPAFLDDLFMETGPEYTVATGLALRHLQNR